MQDTVGLECHTVFLRNTSGPEKPVAGAPKTANILGSQKGLKKPRACKWVVWEVLSNGELLPHEVILRGYY